MTALPPPPPPSPPPSVQGPLGHQSPHRGVLVLVLGIMGIVVCGVCGIIAWVMGSKDLSEIRAGRMDPAGKGLTEAGRICGIVGTCLFALQMLFVLLWLALVLAVGVSAAAGGGRGGP